MSLPACRRSPARPSRVRIVATLVAALTLAACGEDPSVTAPAVSAMPDAAVHALNMGVGAFESRVAPGKCLTVQGEIAQGAATDLRTCDGSAGQQFTAQPNGEIRIGQSLCLDAFSGVGKNGDAIGIWGCHGASNQRWQFTANGQIRGINDKCVDVYGGRTGEGTPIVLWTCHGASNVPCTFAVHVENS